MTEDQATETLMGRILSTFAQRKASTAPGPAEPAATGPELLGYTPFSTFRPVQTPEAAAGATTRAGEPIEDVSLWRHIGDLSRSRRPTAVVAGPQGGEEFRAGEDEDLLEKTECVRHPGERLIALIARTGISPQQIRDLDEEGIRQFCWRAGVNNDWDGVREPRRNAYTDYSPTGTHMARSMAMVG